MSKRLFVEERGEDGLQVEQWDHANLVRGTDSIDVAREALRVRDLSEGVSCMPILYDGEGAVAFYRRIGRLE